MTENGNQKAGKALRSFFILTFAFTWLFWFFAVLSSLNLITLPLSSITWVIIGAHGPLVASLWLTYKDLGLLGCKKLLLSGFRLRMKLAWWIVILVFPLLMAGVAFWINISSSSFQPDTTLLTQPLLIIPNLIFMFFLGGSFQEEFGWRGFALTRLLELQTPFTASLSLGVIWGFWHLPLFYVSGLSQSYMNFGLFMLLTLAFSFIFTMVYIRTGYNLFSALLLHAVINTSMNLFPPIEQIPGESLAGFSYLVGLYLISALLLIISNQRFWFKKAAAY